MRICVLILAAAALLCCGCDEKSAWDQAKPLIRDGLINAGLVVKGDAGVRAAVADGDFELAGQLGLRIFKAELRNTATGWAAGGELERKAYEFIRDEWPLVAAMISRPGGEGLYWRLDAWLRDKGHATGLTGGLLTIELSREELDELYPLALLAVDEEYKAARAYLRMGESTAGLETGGEW